MNKAILQAKNIFKSYGKNQVLKGLDLTINAGEGIAIIGVNGCGKSTLLQLLAGTLTPDTGEILIMGQNPQKNKRLYSNMVGFVPQDNPLMKDLTVKDNLSLWYASSPFKLTDDLNKGLIKRLNLAPILSKKVSQLSGGMQKRVSIACALAQHPSLLILDEPGTSLDLVSKRDIKEYLQAYVKNGGSFILASHELMEIEACNRHYIMHHGKLHPWDINQPLEDLVDTLASHRLA